MRGLGAAWARLRRSGLLLRVLTRLIRPPRRVRPTLAGGLALFGSVLVGAAAVTAANNLLLILMSAGLASVVLSGLLSERNLSGLSVRLRLPGAAYAGELAELEALFYRDHRQAAYSLELREDEAGALWTRGRRRRALGLLELQLGLLEGGQAAARGRRRVAGRGPLALGPCELCTGFPFDLLVKCRDLKVEALGWVRPRRVPLPALLAHPSRAALDGGDAARRGVGTELHGLREWQPRDPRTRIHARRSLALGQEVVLDTAQEERPVAIVGVYNAQDADPEALERAYELAQAALAAWERDGFAPGLALIDRLLPPAGYDREALELQLAQATPSPPARPPAPALWLIPEGAHPPPELGGLRVAADGQLREAPTP